MANFFGPLPLILAVVIHDGEDLDARLQEIQYFPLQKYSNPWIAEGSQAAELLSMEIREFAGHVAHALDRVPSYDPTWTNLATKEFSAIFETRTIQSVPPSLGSMPS